MDRKPVRNM